MENDVILFLSFRSNFLNDIVNYLCISLFCSATQRLLYMELSIYAQMLGNTYTPFVEILFLRIKMIS